jgi:nucleoside 2-deoxyribosyltransferase
VRFYIASSLKNSVKVRSVAEKLRLRGLVQTYDWTVHPMAIHQSDLQEVAQAERDAVLTADLVIVMIPAGKGAHVEYGVAIGAGKEVVLYSETDEIYDLDIGSIFYHLPQTQKCVGTIDDLVQLVFERMTMH